MIGTRILRSFRDSSVRQNRAMDQQSDSPKLSERVPSLVSIHVSCLDRLWVKVMVFSGLIIPMIVIVEYALKPSSIY